MEVSRPARACGVLKPRVPKRVVCQGWGEPGCGLRSECTLAWQLCQEGHTEELGAAPSPPPPEPNKHSGDKSVEFGLRPNWVSIPAPQPLAEELV